MPIPIDDLMTKQVCTLRPTATVLEAAEEMTRHNFGFIVVTTAEMGVRGIISAADIIEKIVLTKKDPSTLEVKDIMSSQVVCAQKDKETIASIAMKLAENKIRRLPVLEDNKLVGVISNTDLTKVIIKHKKELLDLALQF